MPHCFPISITEAEELDIVYEGVHNIYSPLLQSAEFHTTQVRKLEEELRIYISSVTFLFGGTEDELAEARRKEIHHMRIEIKRKKLVKRECEKKIVVIHELLRRLSDPRPTDEQMEEYFDRKRAQTISEIMKGQLEVKIFLPTEVSNNGTH